MEVQPLHPETSRGGDNEVPANYGSHCDKLCLVPFFIFCAALGYYGVKGASEFNIYEQGQAQATELCKPMAEMKTKCTSELKVKATEAANAAKGDVVQGLRRGTDDFTGLLGTVSGACFQIQEGVGRCDDLQKGVTGNSLLTLPAIPSSPAALDPSMAADKVKQVASDMESKAHKFVKVLSSTCENATSQLSSLCSKVNEAMTGANQKIDEALSALANDAVKKMEDVFLQALNKSSGAVCPPIGELTKACGSLSDAMADAIAKAEASVTQILPKEFPKDIIDVALKDAKNAALNLVKGFCQNGADITRDCPGYFAGDQWRPLLSPIRQPLLALQEQLQNATDMLVHIVAGQCDKLSGTVSSACDKAKVEAEGAIDKAKAKAQVGADYTADGVNKFQSGLSDEFKSLHAAATSKFGEAQSLLQHLVGGCSQVSNAVQSQCDALNDTKAGFSTTSEGLVSSLQGVADGGDQVDEGCDKVGDLHETCMAVANPKAALMKGATSLIQHKTSEIVQLECYLLIGCFITVIGVLGIIKWCTKLVVKVSIALNLISIFGMAVGNVIILNYPTALFFGVIFLVKLLWLWCIRNKFDFAVMLIHCGVQSVEKFLGIGAWILGIVLIIAEVGVIILAAGANYLLTGPNPPPEVQQLSIAVPGLVPVLIVFSYVWAMEVLSNIIHVTVCCALGSAVGVKTPAKSSCGAFCFAITGALGSITLGSFWIALLKALQDALERGKSSDNPCVQIIIRAVCCALEWILKFFNAYAFVFVGLKGISYFEAARRTMEVFSKDGVAAVAADEALHDVVKIAKQVVLWVSVGLSMIFGIMLNIIGLSQRSWYEVVTGPVLCWALAAATTYSLTLPMGRLLEAAVCTLFIVFDEYKVCMKESQPELFNELQGACDQKSNSGLLG